MTSSRVTGMMLKVTRKEMSLQELEDLIIVTLGSSPITIKNALRTMQAMGYIKDMGNTRFKILSNSEE